MADNKKLKTVMAVLLGAAITVLVSIIWVTGFQITIVNGESMLPTYNSGDLVISTKQPDYQVEDIIVYHPKDLPCSRCNVIHRIIQQDENTGGWVTQGDNNPNIDVWRPTNDEILGKVIMVWHLGSITHIIFHPFMWLSLLFGAISMILIGLMRTFITKTQTT